MRLMKLAVLVLAAVWVASCSDVVGPNDHSHHHDASERLVGSSQSNAYAYPLDPLYADGYCDPGFERNTAGYCVCIWCDDWWNGSDSPPEHDDDVLLGSGGGTTIPYDDYEYICNPYQENCKLRWGNELTPVEKQQLRDAIERIRNRPDCEAIGQRLLMKWSSDKIALWDARIEYSGEVRKGKVQRPPGYTVDTYDGDPSIWTGYNATREDIDKGEVNWDRSLAHEMLHIMNPYPRDFTRTQRESLHSWIFMRAETCST